MTLPKEITIFGNTIDIIEVDCLNEEMGDFSPITNTIHIARHTLSDGIKCELRPKQREQTFWREVFHAFQYYATGEYDEAQSQVYAGFMSGLGIDIVVGETKIEPLILSLVSAGLRGDTLNARKVANELAEIASALDYYQLSSRIRECLAGTAVEPAEIYRGRDIMLFGLEQRLESGDEDAHRCAVKARDDARKSGNTDFANKVDEKLSEFADIIVYNTNLYIARSTGCGTTQIAIIAATTADEARQLIVAERGQGWVIVEDWMLPKPQARVTVNTDKPQIITIV